jgi:hypothetical protein
MNLTGRNLESITSGLFHHIQVGLGLNVTVEVMAPLETYVTQLALERSLNTLHNWHWNGASIIISMDHCLLTVTQVSGHSNIAYTHIIFRSPPSPIYPLRSSIPNNYLLPTNRLCSTLPPPPTGNPATPLHFHLSFLFFSVFNLKIISSTLNVLSSEK